MEAMKKVIGIVLAAALGLSLTACGGSSSDSDEEMVLSNGEYVTESEAAAYDEANAEGTDAASAATAESEEEEEEAEAVDTSVTIDETVLWEEEDFKITATSLTYTEWYALLGFELENKSDQTLTFYNGTMGYDWSAVNGYMTDSSYIKEEVGPGESTSANMEYVLSAMVTLGITGISDLRFGMAVAYEDGSVTELPETQLKTSAYDTYATDTDTFQEAVDNGFLLGGEYVYEVTASDFDTVYSEKGTSMISEVLAYPQTKTDNDGYPVVYFELENQSDDDVSVQFSDITINDEMAAEGVWSTYSLFSETRRAQCINLNTLFQLYPAEEDLTDEIKQNNGVESVEITLSVEDENGEEIGSPETVTIEF